MMGVASDYWWEVNAMAKKSRKRAVGLAEFIAKDPYTPEATETELQNLLPRIHGVIDWTIHHNGDVVFEYTHDPVNDQVIEEALAGIGFQIEHIFDEPDADEAEVHAVLGH
jgi:hypothetical protein